MQRKVWKNRARNIIQKRYWRSFFVCFLVTLLTGGTILFQLRNTNEMNFQNRLPMNAIEGKTNSDIVNEFVRGVSEQNFAITQQDGFIGNILNNVSNSGSFIFGILNATNQFLFQDHIVAGIIIIVGVLLSILYWIFIAKVLEVGRARFFLENRVFEKTKISRILLPFKVRKNFHVAFVMLQKNIYQFLWVLTIFGGPIKFYMYRLVPYLLAENPTLSCKEVISLSQSMMQGHKWEAFLLDMSFFGWGILGIFTLNITNIFYTNLYMEATLAEYYLYLRNTYLDHHTCPVLLDTYLENKEEMDEYPEEKYLFKEYESYQILKKFDYNRKYSFTSYILLFFAFAMLGWIWEVCLYLFSEGEFVNRGALFGPWLPIYGSGGVLILFLLQKIRNRPLLSFGLTMLICGIVEYGTAFYLETFKHLKWWDYTGYFLNIHGRICLEGLLFFGIGGLAFIYILGPLFDNFFQKWNSKFRQVLCIVLVLLIGCDFIYSSKHPNTGNGITTEILENIDNS